MNWCFEKTTSNERATISDAMTPIMCDLDRAETLLDTVIQDCFSSFKQEAISASEAEWVRDLVTIARDILSDSIVAYRLTVAEDNDARVSNYLAASDRAKTAIKCEKALEKLYEDERRSSDSKSRAIIGNILSIGDMDDADALDIIAGGKDNG